MIFSASRNINIHPDLVSLKTVYSTACSTITQATKQTSMMSSMKYNAAFTMKQPCFVLISCLDYFWSHNKMATCPFKRSDEVHGLVSQDNCTKLKSHLCNDHQHDCLIQETLSSIENSKFSKLKSNQDTFVTKDLP
jgi:hypothetical protein